MPKFLPYDYNQSSMVVINFQDQLQAGTFEHAVHYLIDNKLDLSVFHPEKIIDTHVLNMNIKVNEVRSIHQP